MTGTQAFFSFANFVKTELTGSGITVYIEKSAKKTAPYLVLQNLSEDIASKWLSNQMCQGWLVVEKTSGEPLEVTAGRYLDRVLTATRDAGSIQKYNYEQTPKAEAGVLIPSITSVTGDLSDDPLRSKRVITWELHSNSK